MHKHFHHHPHMHAHITAYPQKYASNHYLIRSVWVFPSFRCSNDSSFSHYHGNSCSGHLFCKQARQSAGPHTSDTGWNTSNWANKTWTMWVSVFLTQISSSLYFLQKPTPTASLTTRSQRWSMEIPCNIGGQFSLTFFFFGIFSDDYIFLLPSSNQSV